MRDFNTFMLLRYHQTHGFFKKERERLNKIKDIKKRLAEANHQLEVAANTNLRHVSDLSFSPTGSVKFLGE